MANQEHVSLLRQGFVVWYEWRNQHPGVRPNLGGANLTGAYLEGFDLSRTNLESADLNEADLNGVNLTGAKLNKAQLRQVNLSNAMLGKATLRGCNLRRAKLSRACLNQTDLTRANLSEADLSEADLSEADLSETNLSEANLSGANLTRARLIETNFTKATLTRCFIYGISAWNVQLEGAIQKDLVFTHINEPIITVDNLKIAQFIYLLLNNSEIRDAIDTITSKVVLILGRFTKERKQVLDTLRDELRKRNYLPVLFDFEKPLNRDITETVATLAHMARFVIADITDAKSIPQELDQIVPSLPSVPVQPLILNSQDEYGMFEHFTRYPWVLPVYRYTDEVNLLQSLQEKVITPAEQKAKELAEQ